MALKEGRCTNCGSILILESNQEKGHCLYCDAVFDSAKAFELAEDASGYVFPNEVQPAYEGPNLDPPSSRPTIDLSQFDKKEEKTPSKAGSNNERIVLNKSEVPTLNLSKKQILTLTALSLIIIGLFVAVMLPVGLVRTRNRNAIAETFSQKHHESFVLGDDLDIRTLSNSQVIIALGRDIQEDEAKKFFTDFCEARGEVMNIQNKDQMYDTVKMTICTPDKGWKIYDENGIVVKSEVPQGSSDN